MNSYPAFGFDSSSSSDESFSVVDDDLLHGNFNSTSNNTISNTKHPTNTNAAGSRNDKFNLNQIEDLLEWDMNNEERSQNGVKRNHHSINDDLMFGSGPHHQIVHHNDSTKFMDPFSTLMDDYGPSSSTNTNNNQCQQLVMVNAGSADDCPQNRLPRKSICYDYIRQPLGIKEQNREFLSLVGNLSNPFLRPILIDGIGLIKAYRQGSSDDEPDGAAWNLFETKRFPIVPIIRCIFYWISRGHLTQVFFPTSFSPMTRPGIYGASDQDLANLRTFERSTIAKFIDEQNFRGFLLGEQQSLRACIVTSIHHWIDPNCHSNLDVELGVYKTWADIHSTCASDHILQPYFGPKGDFVYFSPIRGGKREFTVDTVLDNEIKTKEEFNQFYKYQLNYIDQAKQLKVLYDLLPPDRRVREAHVMMAIMNRIEKFM